MVKAAKRAVQRREYPMTKPELGTKRRCHSCTTKFFDLNKDPIVCPKCAAVFVPPQPDPVRSRRLSERQPWPVRKDAVREAPIEPANANQETKPLTAEAEKVDGDLLLEDDPDEELDTTEVVDDEIEKDDT
jgi:uncharacterized protein (TIGR02300 family)